jgi:lipopolysaccharide assembly protein A
MRYIRYAFLAIIGICLLVVALANRAPVTLRLFPDEIAAFAGVAPEITLPLFIVILGGIVLGLLIGFVWEWLREYRYRSVAASERRERKRLEHEVRALKGPEPESGDDILAILDERAATR